ncbi:hypothetical protein P153DRAFT_391151 [Dothidotthia symphoricarpi CBS 119687]|uniref:Uncharacterized protein n=1 Tax=Dothidotthia symphoricarpi CBS 119687 TaxID=1392245 RepID=A0A6A5ZXV5_9PLEO|nr:uncharacterized protein P153DRAFT_391151 [Dothidotthia symphoricarpi CBS 119687]KAF2123734.1 hypothetical protein P153DRAFT_391151 [Dothidotthia symphoricarpi CBS 119687]
MHYSDPLIALDPYYHSNIHEKIVDAEPQILDASLEQEADEPLMEWEARFMHVHPVLNKSSLMEYRLAMRIVSTRNCPRKEPTRFDQIRGLKPNALDAGYDAHNSDAYPSNGTFELDGDKG